MKTFFRHKANNGISASEVVASATPKVLKGKMDDYQPAEL